VPERVQTVKEMREAAELTTEPRSARRRTEAYRRSPLVAVQAIRCDVEGCRWPPKAAGMCERGQTQALSQSLAGLRLTPLAHPGRPASGPPSVALRASLRAPRLRGELRNVRSLRATR
jgi:hypothetical protein